MKLDIQVEDRFGITQQILAKLAENRWDLLAMEMHRFHIFVSLQTEPSHINALRACLMEVPGVLAVEAVAVLPGEKRRQHLDTLLSRLPDPIIDIDANGSILIANTAAALALAMPKQQLEGINVEKFIRLPLNQLLQKEGLQVETGIGGQSYMLEATPVVSDEGVNGAVIVLRTPQRLGQQMSVVQAMDNHIESIVGRSAPMESIRQQTQRFAQLDLPVLVRGETGTGKELLARALHHAGPRHKAPFLAINCATLSENLLESELFGYVSGAFSGANKSGKPGLLELADTGTVFLDEVAEMSPYLQAKLLRFLEDFTFRRIGGTREITVNVRVICATHQALERMTQQGLFREDLYYRLNVLSLHLPPLRERREDIPALITHFVKRACEQVNVPSVSFSQEAMRKLITADWPGNIRQLQNTLFRAIALNDQPEINDIDIESSGVGLADSTLSLVSLEEAVAAFEKRFLHERYQQYPSTRKLASALQVSHAKIARKLKRYNIGKD